MRRRSSPGGPLHALVHADAILHDEAHMLEGPRVREGVARHGDDVLAAPWLEGTDFSDMSRSWAGFFVTAHRATRVDPVITARSPTSRHRSPWLLSTARQTFTPAFTSSGMKRRRETAAASVRARHQASRGRPFAAQFHATQELGVGGYDDGRGAHGDRCDRHRTINVC